MKTNTFADLMRQPDTAAIELENGLFPMEYASGEGVWNGKNGTSLSLRVRDGKNIVTVAPSGTPIVRIRLRWRNDNSGVEKLLRDSWGCAARDLGWMPLIAEQPLPWYFHTWDGELTHGYGVMTGCESMCFWQMDTDGVNLWLDVRCGGSGVLLDKPLTAAQIVTREGKPGESAYEACQAFCRMMCPAPVLPDRPVYGLNNWYYAYGKLTAQSVRADADLCAELAGDTPYKPFMVIDDGWETVSTRGPFDRGHRRMGDMAQLADYIAGRGCVPGIWIRPLMTAERVPADWHHPFRNSSDYFGGTVLDPTNPEVLDYVAETARRMDDWGYRLIKYDFTCPDLLGEECFYGWKLTQPGWHWQDRSKTNAQIAMNIYRTLKKAAPNCLMQSCNAFNHLSAGINHIQRSGLDTSGHWWEATRTAGVNTLAFRMPQNKNFFIIDPDCPAFTPEVPTEMNLRFMELCALSGAVLIASITPGQLNDEEKKRAKKAFATAASGFGMEPLDWMKTICPTQYRWEGDGQVRRFDWYTPTDGAELR